jgi:hypothetical protein
VEAHAVIQALTRLKQAEEFEASLCYIQDPVSNRKKKKKKEFLNKQQSK